MDLVRYFLALAVIIAHFNIIVGTEYWCPISSATAVSVFFGLSGFLVYASYNRNPDFKQYVRGRMKRILPSYWTIVIVFALGLCILSNIGIIAYFSNDEFWKYILANILFLNFIQPDLPGVFTNNTITCVNGSLWTLKVEWMLYLSIPLVFFIIKRFKCNINICIIALFIISITYKEIMEIMYSSTQNRIYHVLSYQFIGQMIYFYGGVLFYHHIQWIKQHTKVITYLAIATIVIIEALRNVDCRPIIDAILFEALLPIAIVSFFLIICTSKMQFDIMKKIGNCSYEMYLAHFPILQIFASIGLYSVLPPLISFGISLITIIFISFLLNTYTQRIFR